MLQLSLWRGKLRTKFPKCYVPPPGLLRGKAAFELRSIKHFRLAPLPMGLVSFAIEFLVNLHALILPPAMAIRNAYRYDSACMVNSRA